MCTEGVTARITIERSYPECTTSVLTALLSSGNATLGTEPPISGEFHARSIPSDRLTPPLRTASRKRLATPPSTATSWGGGSWYTCFAYAAQFALECLSLVGEAYEMSEHARKGANSRSNASGRMAVRARAGRYEGVHDSSHARSR